MATDNDNDNDNDKRSTNVSQRPGITSMSEGVITAKKSVKTVVPCTLGKVGN